MVGQPRVEPFIRLLHLLSNNGFKLNGQGAGAVPCLQYQRGE